MEARLVSARRALVALAVFFTVFLGASIAFGDGVAPHIADSKDPDACAMCHRNHTSASGIGSLETSSGARHNALIAGYMDDVDGDKQLCYACHGIDSLGSTHDVQSEFQAGDGHLLAPSTSLYGPKNKQCSDCHDTHGTTKSPLGGAYPSLLRGRDASGTFLYSGDAYCSACHVARAGNEYPGLAVWSRTGHARITTPTSGTDIVCSVCHAPHGAAIQPLIKSQITSPAVPSTTTVPANDRRFCEICHATVDRTWVGAAAYVGSAHSSATATIAVAGEWAPAGSSRLVGECQSCHDPMGSSDGAGGTVGRLGRLPGAALCYSCHQATGPAATNLAALAYKPEAGIRSLVVAYGGGAQTREFGQLHLYTRLTTATASLIGPREYASGGEIGRVAAGDVNGDGKNELVLSRTNSSVVSVLSPSAFSGLVEFPGNQTLLAPATFVGVGDVMDDTQNLREVVTADAATVRVYRWNTSLLRLDPVAALSVPNGQITGLAVGPIIGGAHSDIAVTTDADKLVVMTGSGASLVQSGEYSTRSGPVGPSVKDIDGDGHGEIAVANSGESNPVLSVYDYVGTEVRSGGTSLDASATATAIGNILPGVTLAGTSGDEIAVALSAPLGASRLEVYPLASGGFGTPEVDNFNPRTNAESVTTGDIDGEGRVEAVVGLAGYISSDPASVTAPSVAVVHATSNGQKLDGTDMYLGGGAELAGSASVVVADLGAVGPSRHPVEAAVAAHVSTETAVVPEHVACVDCHNTHAATAVAGTAPAVPGQMKGAWGVGVRNNSSASITLTEKDGVDYEYEVCLKCHSTWSALTGARSIASEVNTRNASFHPVEGQAPATHDVGQTLSGGMANGSVIYCDSCHGNVTNGQAAGPHRSLAAPLLHLPFVGVAADDNTTLCMQCHLDTIYVSGNQDGQPTRHSGFYDPTLGAAAKLHSYHAAREITCGACHVTHGSPTLASLIRSDVGWNASVSGGGGCSNGCHTVSGPYHQYVRP